jgi:diguanylate cyclase (GGDEF)-like protein/PAS domain S-box-containing protein
LLLTILYGIDGFLSIAVFILSILAGIYSLPRRNKPGANPFLFLTLNTAAWALAILFSKAAQTSSSSLFWLNLERSCWLLMPVIWILLAMDFTRRVDWLAHKRWLLWVLPGLVMLVMWTGLGEPILRQEITFLTTADQLEVNIVHGPLYFISLVYSTFLVCMTLWLLLIHRFSQPARYRGQTSILFASLCIPALVSILDVSSFGAGNQHTLLLASMIPTMGFMLLALFQYHLFDLVPIARNVVVEQMQEGMLVLSREGKVVDLNPKIAALFGFKGDVGSLIGKHADDYLAAWPDWQNLIHIQKPGRLEINPGDNQYFEVVVTPLLEQENFQGSLSILHEITERKQIENTLRESEERFRKIVEIMPFPLVLTRLSDHRVVYINQRAAETFRVSQKNAIGKLAAEFYVDRTQRAEFYAQLVKDGRVDGWKVRLRRFDDKEFWVSLSATRAEFQGEQVIMTGVSDITEQVGAQTQVEHLYQTERERTRELEGVNQITQAILSSLELDTVMQTLLEFCRQLLPVDVFYVAVYDETTFTVSHPLFYDNGVYHQPPPRDIRKSPGLSGEIILSRRTLFIPDTLDPDVQNRYHIVRTGGLPSRTFMGTPLIAHDRVVGVISMQSYLPDAFSPEQISMLETIARQAALAVENSRLYQAVRQANEGLTEQLEKVRSLQDQLVEMAIRDPLTGLYNRRYLDSTLDRELSRARRERYPIALIMLDIDLFRDINTRFGHPGGDELLKALAMLVQAKTRQGDLACRIGGEEFLLVLPNMPLRPACMRAEELRQAVEGLRVNYGETQMSVTISLGVASAPIHGQTSTEMLILVDQALYKAKHNGRNRVALPPGGTRSLENSQEGWPNKRNTGSLE